MGKGKLDRNSGAIAAGCGAICCMVCFFLVGLPMLITGCVLVRYANGAYDDALREECRTNYQYRNTYDDCVDTNLDDDTKNTFLIVGIILIIVSLLFFIAGVVMILLMFTSLCKKNNTLPTTVSNTINPGPIQYTVDAPRAPQAVYPQVPYATNPEYK